jgi:hypothetical protein
MVMVNVNETNPEGGDFISDECGCHFVVDEFRDFSGKNPPYLEFDFRVLASTLPSAVGKSLKKERFNLTGKGAGRPMELACATGLYTKEQWADDKKAGRGSDVPFDDIVGRQFAGEIKRKAWDDDRDTKYWTEQMQLAQQNGDTDKVEKCQKVLEGKRGRLQLGFDIWAIGDAEADHIPLDADTIATFDGNLPTKHGDTRRRGEPASGHKPAGNKPTGNGANGNGHQPPAGNQSRQPPQKEAAGVGDEFV